MRLATLEERPPYVHRLGDADLPDSDNPDLLWDWLENTLNEAFGVRGIFYVTYPVGDSAGSLQEMMSRALWKTTYPLDWQNAIGTSLLQNDRTALKVLETGRMCRWDDPFLRNGASPAELRRLEINERFGLATGACLPIQSTSGRICGGFGLCSRDLPPDVFYASITEDEMRLTALLARFDARFRGPYAAQSFHITRQERRVLAHMAGGLGVARAAHELGLSPKTVEFYLRGIREKTRSASTAEAVAKAIFFNML
jgi:LuxR family transcriptional regulator